MPRGNALQTLQIHRERIATHHVNCMFPLDCLFVADPGRLVFLWMVRFPWGCPFSFGLSVFPFVVSEQWLFSWLLFVFLLVDCFPACGPFISSQTYN